MPAEVEADKVSSVTEMGYPPKWRNCLGCSLLHFGF
jgi:hypothetical protein